MVKQITGYEVVKGKIVKRKFFEREADAQGAIADATGREGFITYNGKIWKVRSVSKMTRNGIRWYHSAQRDKHAFWTTDAPDTFRVCASYLVSARREHAAYCRRNLRDAERALAKAIKARAAGPQ